MFTLTPHGQGRVDFPLSIPSFFSNRVRIAMMEIALSRRYSLSGVEGEIFFADADVSTN